jgi:hypothetical protein
MSACNLNHIATNVKISVAIANSVLMLILKLVFSFNSFVMYCILSFYSNDLIAAIVFDILFAFFFKFRLLRFLDNGSFLDLLIVIYLDLYTVVCMHFVTC